MSIKTLKRARQALRTAYNTAPRWVQEELSAIDREIAKALKTTPSEQKLKAAAFDHLMAILDGHHRRVESFSRVKRLPAAAIATAPRQRMTAATRSAAIETERVDVLEWYFRINVVGQPDLRKLLLAEQKR